MEEVLPPVDLLLELQNSVEESFGSGRASRDVDVDRDNSVTATDNRVRVVIIPTTICTAPHGDDPAWLRHLVINPASHEMDYMNSKH